jgi:hypothetical protein
VSASRSPTPLSSCIDAPVVRKTMSCCLFFKPVLMMYATEDRTGNDSQVRRKSVPVRPQRQKQVWRRLWDA